MQWFADNDLIEKQPAVAVHGALIFALVGKVADAERWAAAAQRTTGTGTLSDGNTMEATLAYLRTLMSANGIEEMRRDALSALEGLSPTSPYRAAMVHAEGASHLLSGDPDLADSCFVARRRRSHEDRRDSIHAAPSGRTRHRRHRAG